MTGTAPQRTPFLRELAVCSAVHIAVWGWGTRDRYNMTLDTMNVAAQ